MNSNSKMFLSFLAGAAAGVAVAYLINSERGGELVDELKNLAGRVREGISNRMGGNADAGLDDDIFGGGTSQEGYMGV